MTTFDEKSYTVSNGTVSSDGAFRNDETSNLKPFWFMVGLMLGVFGVFLYDRFRSVGIATRTQQSGGSNGAPGTTGETN